MSNLSRKQNRLGGQLWQPLPGIMCYYMYRTSSGEMHTCVCVISVHTSLSVCITCNPTYKDRSDMWDNVVSLPDLSGGI